MGSRFMLSAMCDFNDDCRNLTYDHALLGSMMDKLVWMGVRRLYWNYHQPGFFKLVGDGSFSEGRPNVNETLAILGDPLFAARKLAHERGLEFFVVIKPYETGITHTDPARSSKVIGMPGLPGIGGVYEADAFTLAHPELRIRARTADIPTGLDSVPITRIQLRQKDMAPARVRRENVQIWTSADNSRYERKDVAFDLAESVETCPIDARGRDNVPVTGKGDEVRALNITGLHLLDPFVAVTTDFADEDGTFTNIVQEMVRAYGPDGAEIPTLAGSYHSTWRGERDLRSDDLTFDGGFGNMVTTLDADYSRLDSKDGVIAVAKGRNEYMSGALCEAYPEAQEYWMSWVGECIASGADGVDVRVSNHSCWTNTPGIYGFNEPIAREYERRYGSNPDTGAYEPALLASLRGEYFEQFLRRAGTRTRAAGKAFQVHVELESTAFRDTEVPGRRQDYPGKLRLAWKRWLQNGLADEVTMFGRALFPGDAVQHPFYGEVADEARTAGAPTHYSHPVWKSSDPKEHGDWLEAVYRDGRVSGYTLYETAAMSAGRRDADGALEFNPGYAEEIRSRASSLGILD